jgi:hypothetical protein
MVLDASATAGAAAMVLTSPRASGLLSALEFNYNDGAGANSGNVIKLSIKIYMKLGEILIV